MNAIASYGSAKDMRTAKMNEREKMNKQNFLQFLVHQKRKTEKEGDRDRDRGRNVWQTINISREKRNRMKSRTEM